MADNNQFGEQYYNSNAALESGKLIGTGAPPPWDTLTPETYPDIMKYAGKHIVYNNDGVFYYYRVQSDLTLKNMLTISSANDIPVTGGGGNVQGAITEIRNTISLTEAEIKHIRTSPTTTSSVITVPILISKILQLTINKLNYHGKLDEGGFDDLDFVYRNVSENTEIEINDELLGFEFDPSMEIDILYTT